MKLVNCEEMPNNAGTAQSMLGPGSGRRGRPACWTRTHLMIFTSLFEIILTLAVHTMCEHWCARHA
jgi:hypothetical protein